MSYEKLVYHVILTTKRKRKLITKRNEGAIYQALKQDLRRSGAHIYAINGVPDHVHILCSIPPHRSVSRVIASAKFSSSSVGTAPTLRWSDGFGILTANPRDLGRLIDYVANQKRHHSA